MLHRHTSSAGWVASAGGAIAAQVVPTAAQWGAMLDVLVRLLLAGAGIAVGRLVWEVADRVVLRLWKKPKPAHIDCPIGYEKCPISPAARARASSPDLSAYRDTKPERE